MLIHLVPGLGTLTGVCVPLLRYRNPAATCFDGFRSDCKVRLLYHKDLSERAETAEKCCPVNCVNRGISPIARDVAHPRVSQSSFGFVPKNLPKINFSIPNAGTFAALGFPVGGARGVLYARRSADGIFTGGRYRIMPCPICERRPTNSERTPRWPDAA